MKTAVVYTSQTGFTKRYAEWIAEAVGAECMDLSGVRHSKQIEERIEQLVLQGKMTQTAADTINPYDIYIFCQSELCRRMVGAEQKRKLYKEQPFVFAKAAKKVYPEYDSEQEILVQGIMDAYFEENDETLIITAVVYGLAPKNYKGELLVRPYIVVDGVTYYGKPWQRSMYDTAVALREAGYPDCDDTTKAYVDEIINNAV